jgi:hypothetical protein
MNRFIEVIDQNGRHSSIFIEKKHLEIVGVLPHCSKIQPKTPEDADKLIVWLKEWKKKQGAHQQIFQLETDGVDAANLLQDLAHSDGLEDARSPGQVHGVEQVDMRFHQ